MSRWNPLSNPINYVLLGGKKTPGLADVTGVASPRKWDERRGYGLSASLVFNHGPLVHFSVKLRLYTEQDWADWDRFAPIVRQMPKRVGAVLPGTPPAAAHALDIWHPWLEAAKIKACVVEDVLQAVEQQPGEWMHEIKLIEFRAQKPQLVAVKAAKTTAAVDPVDQRILNNTAEIKRLNNELAKP